MSFFAPEGRMFKTLVIFGTLASCINFPEGYCNSYPNTAYVTFQNYVNGTYVERGLEGGLSQLAWSWIWSGILNVWFIGYLFGTFIIPYSSERFGRKHTLTLSNLIGLTGAIISTFSVSWNLPELFFISRIVSSISSGISFGALILFLQEVTPTPYRGLTSFLSEATFILCNVAGIGFGMNALFGKKLPWLTGISIIPAVVAFCITLPLKETPKYLLLKKKDRDAAMEALVFYQGNQPENDSILDEMLLEGEDKNSSGVAQQVMHVLKTPHLRTPYFTGTLALQLIAGIWTIIYMSTDILDKNFGQEMAQLGTLGFIVANFVASLIGMLIVERFGRRPLLLILGTLNTISLILFIAFDRLTPLDKAFRWPSLISLVCYGITYGIGLGPIAFFIASELVAQQYRSLVVSMVFATNTLYNCAITFIAIPLYNMFNIFAFVPLLVVPSILSLIYLFKWLPETKGREIHDIVEALIASSSATKAGSRTSTVSSPSTTYGTVTSIAPREIGQKEKGTDTH